MNEAMTQILVTTFHHFTCDKGSAAQSSERSQPGHKMEKCYENLIKYFVFLCNLIFALAGACLVGFGAYVQINSSGFEEFIGSSYVIISTFVIVVGGFRRFYAHL